MNGYRITINVWHFAFKVVVLEPPPDLPPTRMKVKLSREIPGAIPIWPMAQGRIVNWPITPALDDLGMSALANAMPVIS